MHLKTLKQDLSKLHILTEVTHSCGVKDNNPFPTNACALQENTHSLQIYFHLPSWPVNVIKSH